MGVVEDFLLNFPRKSTKYQYKSHLKLYFEFLDVDPDTYFDSDRDYKQDVTKYWQHLQKKYSPKSIKSNLVCIKKFLEAHEIDFKKRIWDDFNRRGKGSRVVRRDKVPTNLELRQILSHGDIRDRACFLVMLSSGMRENELVGIRLKDVDLESTPVKITIPAYNINGEVTKTKAGRTTFMSNEARDILGEWLKVKERYTKASEERASGLAKYMKDKYGKKIRGNNDDRIFPYTEATLQRMWNRLLKKSGYTKKDEMTGHYEFHLYTLRKFFSKKMKSVCAEAMVENMMGHEGYMNRPYDPYTDEELAEEYLAGMHSLYIFQTPANADDVESLKEQMEIMQHQMEQLIKQTKWAEDRTEDVLIAKDEYGITRNYTEKVEESPKELLEAYQRQQKELKDIEELGPEQWAWKKKMERKKR